MMKLVWIAQRLPMGAWTQVSNQLDAERMDEKSILSKDPDGAYSMFALWADSPLLKSNRLATFLKPGRLVTGTESTAAGPPLRH